MLGDGNGRGIALVFVLSAVLGFVVTASVFLTRTYRRLNASYAAGDVNADLTSDEPGPVGPSPDLPGPDVLGKGLTEH